MSKKILRVGFDLDGVLSYNPIRTFRPIAAFLKPLLLKKSADKFYFPKTKLEIIFWKLLHLTSFCLNPGISEIAKLVKRKKIKAYIITSRYSFLEKEFKYWVKKIQAKNCFNDCFYNQLDMQPNEFKKLMIKKLRLDCFVEDNYGVIEKLNGDVKNIKVLWITNWLDNFFISYKYKFTSLKDVVYYLTKQS